MSEHDPSPSPSPSPTAAPGAYPPARTPAAPAAPAAPAPAPAMAPGPHLPARTPAAPAPARSDVDVRAAQRGRRVLWLLFLLHGVVLASFNVRLPVLKQTNDLTDGQFGVALTATTVGAVVAMQFAGGLTLRFGTGVITRVSAAALPMALLAIALADGFPQLVAVLLVHGALGGTLDVAVNAQAVEVERALRRPVMNSCHALWSIGAIIGSLLGGLATKTDRSLAQHYLALGVVVVALVVITGRWLLPSTVDAARRSGARTGAGERMRVWRAGWSRPVLLLGAMGGAALLCEGAVGTWSGVFLHEDRGATLATASLAYIGFTVLQTAGRLAGDHLQHRLGAPRLIRYSGLLAVGGLAVAVSPWPVVGVCGFAMIGAGLSVILPVVFSAVGHGAADPGTAGHGAGNPGAAGDGSAAGAGGGSMATTSSAISRVTTIAYSGVLVGPVLVGWFAEFVGLTATLVGTGFLLLGVVFDANRVAAAGPSPSGRGRRHPLRTQQL